MMVALSTTFVTTNKHDAGLETRITKEYHNERPHCAITLQDLACSIDYVCTLRIYRLDNAPKSCSSEKLAQLCFAFCAEDLSLQFKTWIWRIGGYDHAHRWPISSH